MFRLAPAQLSPGPAFPDLRKLNQDSRPERSRSKLCCFFQKIWGIVRLIYPAARQCSRYSLCHTTVTASNNLFPNLANKTLMFLHWRTRKEMTYASAPRQLPRRNQRCSGPRSGASAYPRDLDEFFQRRTNALREFRTEIRAQRRIYERM